MKEYLALHKQRLQKIVRNLKNGRVLVMGDLILDEFLWGDASRISPEAPVPVVWVQKESFMPGGGANVANNMSSLGGKVYIAGVVGADERAGILTEELKAKNIDVSSIIRDSHRQTTLKTRVIARHQQVVRIDREIIEPISANIIKKMIARVQGLIQDIDAIIIEDYGKGVITPKLLEGILALARKYKKIVTVDPKEEHFHYYKGVTAITPNHYEAAQAAGIKIKDKESIVEIGKTLLDRLKCKAVLITLGENGMQLFERNGDITYIPTVAQEVFDISGAGDTVIATFTLALAVGASTVDAAYISNFAGGIVVGKVGIGTAVPEELLARLT